MGFSILAIAAGASIGASLRWILGTLCNHWFPDIPPGTLIANLLGAWLIGIAVSYFAQVPTISPYWRLFVITGGLGALTTFSTFSMEMVTAMQAGRWTAAVGGILIHVLGSLTMTVLGIATYSLIKQHVGG